MTAVTAENPHGSDPLTVEALERMPDDGRRYELLDGVLLVSPAPGTKHQKVALRLGALLEATAPEGMETFVAPYAVRSSVHTELQPDVLVAREEDLTDKYLFGAPLLAVEVLSPSTALIDINMKKAAYQRMGVRSYWVIDPIDARVTVFELNDVGMYEQVAEAKGFDGLEVALPFPLRVVPAELQGRLWGKD